MARFFRSDPIEVGDRVVARRQFGEANTPYHNAARGAVHSDVIGHVLSVDPLVIRPQQVGGYPSDLPAVEIPAEQLYVVKKLSPRTVRNSDIRRAEAYLAGAALDDAPSTSWTSNHQWFLRDGEPAVPLGPSAAFEPVPVEEIAESTGEPVRLLVPERIGKPAERLVDRGGWTFGPEQLVMANRDTEPPYVVVDAADKDRVAELEEAGYLELHRRRVATRTGR